MPDYAGKSLRFASKGCHSSSGLKPWGFLACFIKGTAIGFGFYGISLLKGGVNTAIQRTASAFG